MIGGDRHCHEVVGEEQQHDQWESNDALARQQHAEAEKKSDLHGFYYLVQRIGKHPLVNSPAGFY
ncbi:MAG TPA: hypothetical protein VNE82_10185 [Candidatus Binataceae bacterium]|nr:hypothetical protein [Candidatus Binataceae bacterium]